MPSAKYIGLSSLWLTAGSPAVLFNGTAAILIDVAGVALTRGRTAPHYLPDEQTAGSPCDKRHHDEQLAPDLVRDRYISRHFLAAFDSFTGVSPNAHAHSPSKRRYWGSSGSIANALEIHSLARSEPKAVTGILQFTQQAGPGGP